MATITVTVLVGREKHELTVPAESTFGDIRAKLETDLDLATNGLRLLHKGKSMADEMQLSTKGVTPGTKLMALRTAKQHAADTERSKLCKMRAGADGGRPSSSSPTSRNGSTTNSGTSAQSAGAQQQKQQKQQIGGDAAVDGMPFVIISKGRSRYRINTSLEISMVDLKARIASLPDLSCEARDIRLLTAGKMQPDGISLQEAGVKSGASLMAFFTARQHDRQRTHAETAKLGTEITALETRIQMLRRKAGHRLLPLDEIAVGRATLTQEVTRIRGNVNTLCTDRDMRSRYEKRLDSLDDVLEHL